MFARIRKTIAIAAATLPLLLAAIASFAADIAPADARAIAKDAYIYGFPIVDSYRIMYSYFVDKASPEYKAPWNHLQNNARVYTPADKAIQTPNSDTPYSFLGADLRAEPLVLTLPPIEKGRYFSVQFIDMYTFNFAYAGSRTTGNDGGHYLLAGPGWRGEIPKGIRTVMRSETDFVLAIYRTQLFDAADIENVKKIQAGYKVETLSEFLGTPRPPAAPPVDFPKPLSAAEERTSPRFFELLDFLLQFGPTHPSEVATMARFATLGIGSGQTFDERKMSPATRTAIADGMADAWAAFKQFKETRIDTGLSSSADGFGTREYLKNDYLQRMSAAVLGIYGNSRDEAVYPAYFVDAQKQPLDGAHRYTLRFAPGQLPPANAFWSLTMYQLPSSLLYANPLDRYLINSSMLPKLVKDADGGITLHLQHDSPGKDAEANWLPAPVGPFFAILRIYWPNPEAWNGSWQQPPLQKVD